MINLVSSHGAAHPTLSRDQGQKKFGGKILVFIVRNIDKFAYRYKYQTQRIQRRPWTPSSTSRLPEISNHRGDHRLRDATAAKDLGTGEGFIKPQ
jgi:hypothetical protein